MIDLEQVRQRIDIVDLISQHVTLRRAGRNFVALCPFHTEKTPSFHVDPARQSWHCFGACSTGGDIFAFLMKKDGLDFREALRVLAERAGVESSERRDPQEDARRARLFEINEAAAAAFAAALANDAAQAARDYLAERRLAPESVERFQLGYAANSWDATTTMLRERGFSDHELRESGLAVEGERSLYDRFRHRLMFPIRDDRGRVCGFGGRVLPGEALGGGSGPQPKYVNTSQSPIFDKSAILYALDLAKDAIRTDGLAVIVEGYMDVIAAHEHGFHNVVASMGTALTERQVQLLKRHTRNLVLALDADAAGSEATRRGVQVVAENVDRETVPVANWRGVIRHQETLAADIRVLTMPPGRDPDDVIRGEPELWPRLVAEAKPVLDYLFDAAASRHNLTDPRERSAAVAELLPMIGAVSDKVVQSHYLQRLARIAQVDEQSLRQDMRAPLRRAVQQPGQSVPPVYKRDVRDRREEFCLALLIRYPEARAEGEGIDPELFARSENRALFEAWAGWTDHGEPFEDALTPDLRPQFERLKNLDLPAYDDDALTRALRSTVWGIEQQRLQNAKRASAAVIAGLAGDDHDGIAERARNAWETGGPPRGAADTAEDEADPAAAFVEDMEAGRKVHQRILDQRRGSEQPRDEVVNER